MTAVQIRKRLKWLDNKLYLGELQVGELTYIGPFAFGSYSYGLNGVGNATDAKWMMKKVEDAVVKSILTELDE